MNTPEDKRLRNAWVLLFFAIIFWGVNWPLMKVGLTEIGPLWFAAFRVALAALGLFALLGLQGKLHRPQREDAPVLISVGVFQMGVFMALTHTAVQYVDAGRSAVLVYTTPIWIAPLAYWILAERLSRTQLVGIMCAVLGVLVMFNPRTFLWQDTDILLGNLLLICAAMVWAGVIVHVRSFGWTRPHLSVLPWQLALGATVLIPMAWLIEGAPNVPITEQFVITMAFNAIFATAFAFWAYLSAAKTLPANTTAMASLGVPVVGIGASVFLISESLNTELMAGLTFVILGQVIYLTKSIGRSKGPELP